MKKLFNVLGIIAASAIAFTACQEASVEAPVTPNLVTVTFTAQTPGTKLAATEGETAASYKWTDEDAANMKLFTVSGTTVTAVENPTVTKVSDTELSISAEVEAGNTYTFRAIIAAQLTTSNNPRLADTQNPKTDTFDPNAVVLVSEDTEVVVGQSPAALDLTFTRYSVASKMTLKGLEEGEKIDKVIITSDQKIIGSINKSDTGWAQNVTYNTSVVTLNYNKAVTVPASGEFPVYFTTFAADDNMLTVSVITDQHTYSKATAFGPIDFEAGKFTRFGVKNMAVEALEDLSGYYIIGSLASSKWQLMNPSLGSNTYYPRVETSVTTAKTAVKFSDFSGVSGIDDYIWQVATYDGAYCFRSVKTGKYLSYSGSSNAAYAVDALDATAKFSITISADAATIESLNVSGRKLRYNSSSPRFAFYTSAQTDVFMIPATYDASTPSITVTSANPLEVANTASSQTITYTITNPGEASLTASENADWITNLNYGTAGSVTFDVAAQENGAAARSAVITLSYSGADDVQVTVNQAAGPAAGPAGLSLPIIDNLLWVTYVNTSGDNSSKESATSILDDSDVNYVQTATNYYQGRNHMVKFGTSSAVGGFETKELNLSEEFDVILTAKRYGNSSNSQIQITVDGSQEWTIDLPTSDPNSLAEYTHSFSAASSASTIKLTTFKPASSGDSRAYIGSFAVVSKGSTLAPVIKLYNPEAVLGSVTEVSVPFTLLHGSGVTVGASIATDAQSWITAGTVSGTTVTLTLTTNSTGSPRSGVVTLSAPGATDKTFTITQNSITPGTATINSTSPTATTCAVSTEFVKNDSDVSKYGLAWRVKGSSADYTTHEVSSAFSSYTIPSLESSTEYEVQAYLLLSDSSKIESALSYFTTLSASSTSVTLWAETWAGASNKVNVSEYAYGGTTVYNDGTVTYSSTDGGTKTLTYVDDQMKSGTNQENLLLSKTNGTLTVSGIPTAGKTTATLSFKTNAKRAVTITSSNANVTIGAQAWGSETSKPYSSSCTITFTSTVTTFDLVFTNAGSDNVRVDDFTLVAQ